MRRKTHSPDTNFGSAAALEVDASPNAQSYLRFSTSGLTGTIQQAVLRLYVSNSSSNGPSLDQTTGTWQENAITWRNRPARDPATVVANVGQVNSGAYIDYDVTALLRARMNATYDFELDPDSTDGTDFHSDEGPNPPRLIVS